jgi:hypothetical protein
MPLCLPLCFSVYYCVFVLSLTTTPLRLTLRFSVYHCFCTYHCAFVVPRHFPLVPVSIVCRSIQAGTQVIHQSIAVQKTFPLHQWHFLGLQADLHHIKRCHYKMSTTSKLKGITTKCPSVSQWHNILHQLQIRQMSHQQKGDSIW